LTISGVHSFEDLHYDTSVTIQVFHKFFDKLKWLKKVMSHSSINVSLTYLRGLEIAELTEEDMPII
jgi:hypothetical protein